MAGDPVTPDGNGIVTLKVASEVRPLRSTAGKVILVTFDRASGEPVRMIVTGSTVMSVTRKQLGGGLEGGESTTATWRVEVPLLASM